MIFIILISILMTNCPRYFKSLMKGDSLDTKQNNESPVTQLVSETQCTGRTRALALTSHFLSNKSLAVLTLPQ